MSAPLILRPSKLSLTDIAELREIFFESSSKKEFKDEAEKESLYQKYLGFYLVNYPEYLWIAKSSRVLGYVVGMPRTQVEELYVLQPHLKVFEEFFRDFPAHLHINCHTEARGTGAGSKLLLEIHNQFQRAHITGLHIMTSPDSRNRSFYQRLGFDFEITLEFSGHPILLMGKRLKSED